MKIDYHLSCFCYLLQLGNWHILLWFLQPHHNLGWRYPLEVQTYYQCSWIILSSQLILDRSYCFILLWYLSTDHLKSLIIHSIFLYRIFCNFHFKQARHLLLLPSFQLYSILKLLNWWLLPACHQIHQNQILFCLILLLFWNYLVSHGIIIILSISNNHSR